jgi:hypothetical protein
MVRNTKYPDAQAAAMGNPNSAINLKKSNSILYSFSVYLMFF